MAQPYVGEIRLFAGNYAPNGWLFCEGQHLPISENETLYQLIGTMYGGDGETEFALPDLRGRLAVHQGQRPGTNVSYQISEQFGVEQVALSTQQMPSHSHPFVASTAPGTSANPTGNVVASPPSITMYVRDSPSTALPSSMVAPVGGSQPHDNRMPVVAVHSIISLYGIFPSPT